MIVPCSGCCMFSLEMGGESCRANQAGTSMPPRLPSLNSRRCSLQNCRGSGIQASPWKWYSWSEDSTPPGPTGHRALSERPRHSAECLAAAAMACLLLLESQGPAVPAACLAQAPPPAHHFKNSKTIRKSQVSKIPKRQRIVCKLSDITYDTAPCPNHGHDRQ